MASPLQDLILEFTKTQISWRDMVGILSPIKVYGDSILDLTIGQIEEAEVSINDALMRIMKVSDIMSELRLLEREKKLVVEQRDIDLLSGNLDKIAKSTTGIQEHVEIIKIGRINKASPISKTRKHIEYINDVGHTHSFDASDYVYPILSAATKIIDKYEDQIELVKSGDISARVKIEELESIIDVAKQQSEEKLKELEGIIENAKKSGIDLEVKTGKKITSEIIRALFKKRKSSEEQLKWATYIHIGALAGFFIYLFVLFFDPPDLELLKLATGFWQNLSLRALLVSPYALLIIFTSKYYNRVFRRNEYFASKYIIASLIEGFKRQATDDKYKDAIASTVFSELLLDPADYLDRMEKRKKEKESVIASLIDRIKNKTIDAIAEKVEAEIEKPTTKKTTPPTPTSGG